PWSFLAQRACCAGRCRPSFSSKQMPSQQPMFSASCVPRFASPSRAWGDVAGEETRAPPTNCQREGIAWRCHPILWVSPAGADVGAPSLQDLGPVFAYAPACRTLCGARLHFLVLFSRICSGRRFARVDCAIMPLLSVGLRPALSHSLTRMNNAYRNFFFFHLPLFPLSFMFTVCLFIYARGCWEVLAERIEAATKVA
ncbi:hypothetical protein TcCL_ESM12576, partial [Trypanosoma cruzi]